VAQLKSVLRRPGAAVLGTAIVGTLLGALTAAQPALAGQTNISAPLVSWAYTDSAHPHTTYANPTTDVPVGHWADASGKRHTSRVYAVYDISGLAGKQILVAHLFGRESRAADCTDHAIEVWTTSVDTQPTWDDPPAERTLVATITDTSVCPANIAVDVASQVRQALAAKQSRLALEVRVPAADENKLDFARWLSAYQGLTLSVGYDTPPQTPTELYSDYLPCEDHDSHQYLTAQPRLQANFIDADANDTLTGEFAIWPADHPDQRTTFAPYFTLSGRVSGAPVPAPLTDGTRYAWQARLSDGTDTSAWSRTCYFTVDSTPPSSPPGVVSSNYPDNGQLLPGGTPAHFTFSAAGVSDIAGYLYAWDNPPGVSGYTTGDHGQPIYTSPLDGPGGIRAAYLGGPASVDLSPPRAGINTLYVESMDRASNISSLRTYRILVGDTAPTITAQGGVPTVGQPITLTFTPNPALSSVDSYTYEVNFGPATTIPAGADGTATVTVTPTQFGQFGVSVRSHSPNGWVSPEQDWTIIVSNAPRVSSDVYPEVDPSGTGGGGVGIPGTFVFAPGMPGVTSYVYSVDWGDMQTLAAGTDGKASFSYTPDTAGMHEIEVYSVTADGSQSDYYFYDFTVNG
jgi:hypothetical protein